MVDDRTSSGIWCIKALAVLTIFYAHLSWTGDSNLGRTIYDCIGCIGVPLFMFMAGFFNFKSKSPLIVRVLRLFIPLLIWGTITFAAHIFFDSKGITLSLIRNWARWLYGCGTWYYFIAVLLWCQILTKYIDGRILIIVGLGSMALTYWNVIPYGKIITPYTNPFNFIVYFLIGRYFSRLKGDRIVFSNKWVVLSLIICVVFIIAFKVPYYWNVITPIFTICIFSVLWFTVGRIPILFRRVLVKIGKVSFVIYLMHMQLAQAFSTRFYTWMGGVSLQTS